MKKIFVISILATGLFSCAKERTCTCTTTSTLAGSVESKDISTDSKALKGEFRRNYQCYDRVTTVEASPFTPAYTSTCKLK
jgi:hypothetical protein